MKLAIENFFLPIKCGLIGMLLTLPLHAAEQELWYDANGKPILIKDKASGRMRVLSAEEIAAYGKAPVEAKVTPTAPTPIEQEIDLDADKPIAEVTPSPSQAMANNKSSIPLYLAPKVYAENKYYIHRNNYYSPYYSTYPYISRPVIPRFSNNGYYGPAQYYRPRYNHYHHGNHGYHRNYNNNCGNGFLLRYSRPGFTIQGRF